MAVEHDLENALQPERAGASTDPFYNDIESGIFYNVFEVKEEVGRGLASVVRRCIEKQSKREYAVKIVDVSTERQSEKEAKRLKEETLSEIELLKLLSGHPSIITLHDFYTTPTFIFTIFELARGELFDQLNRAVTFSEKRARPVMRQLFDGVDFMHEKMIVHRDLKLENILCIDDRRVVISDFGFAKQLEPGQKLKDLFGTPGYLAPETLRCQWYEDAEGYGLEADDWALGVILYTLLAGYAPFFHRQQLRMMRMIQEGKYEFNREQWENITEEAKDLINRLLKVNVNERIRTRECLEHPWMKLGGKSTIEQQQQPPVMMKKNLAKLFRIAQLSIRFMIRLKNLKQLKLKLDREDFRLRPYRSRDVRHEAESAAFGIYGHWVNRGFYYTRDMLFANRPKPKFVKLGETSKEAGGSNDSGISSNGSTK